MPATQPIVAIIGRPNVGKSTLFNRLLGQRRAITADLPGTTRDRIYGEAEWQGSRFTVIDTGGLSSEREGLGGAVNEQVRQAVEESDLVLVVTAATDGLTGEDREVVAEARKHAKQVVLVVNKVDHPKAAAAVEEFHQTGYEPVAVSALHGRGTGDLADRIIAVVGSTKQPAGKQLPTFTVVGRPNAGKSTLFNQLVGGTAAITDAEPHTTRDPAVRHLETPQGTWRLLDTAGMTKAKRSRSGIPYWSLLRTLRAITESDVAVLLIDAEEGPTLQDAHIAAHILDSGTGLVIAVNKWDLVEKAGDVQEKFFAKLQKRLPFLPSPPVVFISGKTGEKVDRLLRAVGDVYQVSQKRVSTAELNRLVQNRLSEYAGGRRRARLYYLTQTATLPPTFICFVNQPDLWKEDLRRHLAGALRDEFEMYGAALRLEFRKSKGREVAA